MTLDHLDKMLFALARDYEQSGRALYQQMLAQLPWWRRVRYTQAVHYDRLTRLAHVGLIETRAVAKRPYHLGGSVWWYRRAPRPAAPSVLIHTNRQEGL